ncbi:KGGVGR-motif variant AAA ATPase [Candidatus Electronema sp. TJ]|uniref:KGGVGR-motif variant AAA ATPase n=1 Tax=Candidatus Electronema sp. TJ TaxID=3401573 RepID=UPI003AA85726
MNFSRLLTWLDVKRVIREVTVGGRKLPDGIVRISCYSDALEIGIQQKEQIEKAKKKLKDWFGEWYQEEKSVIQLDFGDGALPVEFIYGEEPSNTDISPRPFWEEMAYLEKRELDGETEFSAIPGLPLPQPFLSNKPKLVSFYSFKGGVGRTLHLAAFLFALLDRAKELGQTATVLVIDADLEAPGLTYWNRQESQQPSVSFLDFLEIYQYAPSDIVETLDLFAKEIKKAPKTDGRTTWYFLPACLKDRQLLDTPVLPEHLARNQDGWECGKAVFQLGQAVGADYVLIDLRAGLSEISSPILFDPRIQRYIVTTITEQSVSGTSLVLDQISCLAPPASTQTEEVDYYDPSLIISMLKPELKDRPAFADALVKLRSAYDLERLQISETDFAEELLYINGWEDARSKLAPSSIMRTAREWAKSQLKSSATQKTGYNKEGQLSEARKLREVCKQYEFAENGKGKGLLVTDPLKNLAAAFSEELPRAVSIGAKGAGKTFNYIQLSQFRTWEKFVEHVLKRTPETELKTETYIFPLLQSKVLKDDAAQITMTARDEVTKALDTDLPEFSPSACQDRIKEMLHKETCSELEWTSFWVGELQNALGIGYGSGQPNTLTYLNNELKQRGIKVVFLFDGLEDVFTEISSNSAQQSALRALIDLPKRLSEIRQANIGVIIFLRRDFLRHIVTQNLAQFENLYRAYDLSWDEESFKRLVFWICSQAGVIDAKAEEVESLSRDELNDRLEQLWGMKLGADSSKEASSINWIFAALTDFKGRIQARDIVRFLLHAAKIAIDHAEEVMLDRWATDRMLPPQAIRRAIVPCSREKVDEAKEEYPEFKRWVEKIADKQEKKIPFTLEHFDTNQDEKGILEEMGVIYEDREKDGVARFYMPEIFRSGLDFTPEKGARPRVLVLKRKALGPRYA